MEFIMNDIILGVTGSIAAYKAAEIASQLTKNQISVHTIMTKSAERFIAPLTFQTLTKNKVHTEMFESNFSPDVQHISLAQRAQCCMIAPATANVIGKIASGIADDMLSTVVMAIKDKPIIICPAMNTAMYENQIVKGNISKLIDLGYIFVEPKEALLACGDLGKGALADIEVIIETVKKEMKVDYH